MIIISLILNSCASRSHDCYKSVKGRKSKRASNIRSDLLLCNRTFWHSRAKAIRSEIRLWSGLWKEVEWLQKEVYLTFVLLKYWLSLGLIANLIELRCLFAWKMTTQFQESFPNFHNDIILDYLKTLVTELYPTHTRLRSHDCIAVLVVKYQLSTPQKPDLAGIY